MNMKEEFVKPKWLNEIFLKNALSRFTKENIRVLKFEAAPVTEGHFASSLMKVKITYKSMRYYNCDVKVMNVIIKSKPTGDDLVSQVASSGPLFETEIQMYEHTIPAIYNLLRRCGLKANLTPE